MKVIISCVFLVDNPREKRVAEEEGEIYVGDLVKAKQMLDMKDVEAFTEDYLFVKSGQKLVKKKVVWYMKREAERFVSYNTDMSFDSFKKLYELSHGKVHDASKLLTE